MTEKKRRPFKCTGTVDIECADWDRFVLGGTYDGHRANVWHSGDEMIDHLRSIGGVWWAHAGGVYDLLYVLERARARGIPCQVDRSQHRVTRIVMGRLQLRDSYGLWPVPLDEICGALGRPAPALPWGCGCGRDCGGYCRIGDHDRYGDPDLDDYVIADCKALYDGLHLLDEFCTEHGIALRGTLGQTAWIAAQDELGVPDSEMPWHLWRHARKGDKGGRGAIVRPRAHGPGAHHDICNAYPAQLAKLDLPIGACKELGGDSAKKALKRLRPGIYTVTVRIPDDSFFPPLPYAKAGMLAFPVGQLTGSWPLPELIAAFERGVTLEAAHSAITWETTAPIFGPLIERWYAIRRKVGRRSPLGQWIGRLAKAGSGKLAERPDRQRVTFFPDSVKVCLRQGPCARGCTKRCGAYEQMDLFGHVWGIPYSRLGPSSYPQWSAYLRAGTRVQWLEQAERFAREICFGNTDSLWHTSRESPEPLGDGLGEWEHQHAWCDLEVRSLTAYAWRELPKERIVDEEATRAQGRIVYRTVPGALHIHGVPGITEEDWKRGHGVLDRGIVTLGRAVKSTRGLFFKRQRRWSLPEGDRLWYGDRKMHSDGVTYPATVDELRDMANEQKKRRARREAGIRVQD